MGMLLAVLVGSLVTTVTTGSAAAVATKVSAAQVRAMDPGARLGGQTVVGTTRGQRLVGPSTSDVMVALGSDETLVGGAGDDQLGAVGSHATLRGGAGQDQLYGGPDSTLIGGAGRDLLVDEANGATIRAGSGDDVIVSGHDVRVLCGASSTDLRIYVDRDDSVASTCRKSDAVITPVPKTAAGRARLIAAKRAVPASGDGSNLYPFVQPCDEPGEDCTVHFATRSFSQFLQNEYIPAYSCPADHPYLLNQSFAPAGTSLPLGVQVYTFNVGVSITGAQKKYGTDYLAGTYTGFPYSSATNWALDGRGSYRVVLHCTSSAEHGTIQGGPGVKVL
jgi:Ca2+-binding RTX toxin-like protein